MIELPFNKWTLTFHNQEYEQRYENEQNIVGLKIFRVMAFCISLTAMISLIIFVVEDQSDFIIYEMAFVLAGCLIMLIVSHKLILYLKYAYSFIHTLCIVTTTLIIQSEQQTLFCVWIQYFSFHDDYFAALSQSLKIYIHFGYTSLIMGIFGVYEINFLQYILFTVTGMIILAIYTHHSEFISKLAFSQGIIIQKQREIIYECVKESLLFIKFNQLTNQFELQFQNQQSEQLFSNTQQMKEFLRNYYIVQQEINNEQVRKLKNIKLEDYLFSMLKQKQEQRNQKWLECLISTDYSSEKIYSIKFQIITSGHPFIILLIQQNHTQTIPKEEQTTKFQQIIVPLMQSLAKSSQNLYQQIKQLQNKMKNKNLKIIQYSTLAFINQIKNILIYYQKEKLNKLSEKFDYFFLYQLFDTFEPYFTSRSQLFKREFQLNQLVMPGLTFKLNSQILIQIIVNFFEFSLKHSTDRSTIVLTISLDQSQYFESLERKQKLSDQEQYQKLLLFNLKFTSQYQVNLEVIEQVQDKNIDLQIDYPVSCLLLGIIGPFDHIIVKSVQNENEYLNNIIFYIYADQSQLDPSFTKYISSIQ